MPIFMSQWFAWDVACVTTASVLHGQVPEHAPSALCMQCAAYPHEVMHAVTTNVHTEEAWLCCHSQKVRGGMYRQLGISWLCMCVVQ